MLAQGLVCCQQTGTDWRDLRSISRRRAWQAVQPPPAPVSRQISLTVAAPQTAIASDSVLSLTWRQWQTIVSVQSASVCVRLRTCIAALNLSGRKWDLPSRSVGSRTSNAIENESQFHVIIQRGRGNCQAIFWTDFDLSEGNGRIGDPPGDAAAADESASRTQAVVNLRRLPELLDGDPFVLGVRLGD